MIHNDKFRADSKTENGVTRVWLKGAIDEDTDLSALAAITTPLIVNFEGVNSINSCGIRTWVNLIKELSGISVTYENCPPLIVRQMNMVPSFLGHAQIASVFVPYVCDQCEVEKLIPVTSQLFAGGIPQIAESSPCTACGKGEMELDGNPKQYFAFAK